MHVKTTEVKIKSKKIFFENVEPYLYLMPALIIFGIFVFFPLGKTIFLSLNATTPQGKISYFVGLDNYINLMKSPSFRNSLFVTGKFALINVAFSIFIGFIVSILANEKVFGTGVFRTIYALPMAISSASAAIIWMFIFHPSIGILNYTLKLHIGWLTDPNWALFSVAIVTIWMNIGINFIFIIAALQNIPADLYESASIDGASFFRKHLSITIPSIMPTLFFLLIIDIINSFQAFGQINLMTTGGPGEATNLIVYSIYREAFFNNRYGIASAESIILFIILLILTIFQFKVGEKKVNY
ncbi:carbohydrate ABC transporter permease [Clostridium sp.]|uniref:carbohydrate ABC transporter permease n=1 Tax=Clostridium sp. TaxID=1506 RepID=UPI003D6CD48C